VRVSEGIIADPLTSVRGTVTYGEHTHLLTPTGARRTLLNMFHHQQQQHWTGLKLQGKLACLPYADHSVSHSFLRNTALNEDIITFTVKARLQVLPTKLNLSLWFPSTHAPHCLHHTTGLVTETMSHILNGCYAYKVLYIAHHDRIVDLITKDISKHFVLSVRMYKHSCVKPSMFYLCTENPEIFAHLSANTPDVIVVNEGDKSVSILEMACTFDSSLEEAFMTKVIKYQPLLQTITELGYRCNLFVFIFGSLGHVHRLVVRGFQQLGMPKKAAKRLAKFCAISSTIGSRQIWRRRCYMYP
jgi:hypothetical protein